MCALFSVTTRAHKNRCNVVRGGGDSVLRHKCPLCRSIIAELVSDRHAESFENAAAYARAQRASAHRLEHAQARRTSQIRTRRAHDYDDDDDDDDTDDNSEQDHRHMRDGSDDDNFDTHVRRRFRHWFAEQHEQDYLGYVDYPDESDLMW